MSRIHKLFILLVATLIITLSFEGCGGLQVTNVKDKKVIVFANEFNYNANEYNTIVAGLKKAGATIVASSTTKRRFVPEEFKFMDELNIDEYDGIIFIDSSSSDRYWGKSFVQGFVKKLEGKNKIIGALGGGVTVLTDSGIAKGKKVASEAEFKSKIQADGAIPSDKKLEIDSNFITCAVGEENGFLKSFTAALAPSNK